ncbi:hypothetical protein KUTeg_022004 [Tegillarca granosa]|uniref:Microsomal glutathione S-transferase 1 n=1 Tax=Tegillarca granosa TaxID=220873 RepID=A0ABQ9E5T2_TEGGR|nr:hypothetical protein KUTeg_022004 [Tegillarca granosa]
MANSSLSFDNPIFAQFAFYAAVVLLKTLAMSVYTIRFRLTKKPTFDEDVERVRRCHLNDLENVLPFVLLGILYVTTGPDPGTAAFYFRMFAACRIMHTIAYLTPLPQPSRVLMFIGGHFVNMRLAVTVLTSGSF